MVNLYGISNLLAAITNSALAVFVYIKGYKSKLCRIWGIFTFCVAIYGFGAYKAAGADTYEAAFFWWQVSYVGVIMLPALFTHFVYTFLGIKKTNLVRIVYVLCFIILLADIFSKSLFVGHVSLKFQNSKWFSPAWWIYPPGPLHIFHTIGLYFGLLTYVVAKLIASYRKSDALKRTQIKYFGIAMILGFAGGGTSYLPCFGINLYPILNITVPIYTLIVTYAIIRHQLMDIEVVIKKTLVFASLFAVVLGIFIGITLITQELIAGGRFLGLVISSIIIILSVRPMEDFLVKVTDKYLFQKKYDYKQILKSFIDEVITVLNLDKIIQSTIELLDKTLHPETNDILLLNRYEDKYLSYKAEKNNEVFSLDSETKIINLLKTTKDIFSLKEKSPTKIDKGLRYEMERLKAELAIPLMLHNDLIGIMVLGKKKSDEGYTKEDLDILTDLARTEAVAIGNAQLFAETAQNERRAAIGTLAAGINHEVGNPLNIINTKLQIYLMSLEKGLYKDKKQEDVIKEAEEIMKTCLKQTARISDITKKLSNFAKPSKEFKPEKTDIEEQIEETLSVVGHELELERIEIKKDIEPNLPNILADKRQIQQIFFNLIKNAGQAIQGKGSVNIKARKSTENNAKVIKIEISDTGHGIQEEKLDKIYDPFFTTKGPGKGTGLGLSIVRQLVWRNKGDISVKSKPGEDTTFTLIFPEEG